jgi:hypothetical protein
VRTCAIRAVLYNMFVQFGNIDVSNLYRDEYKPLHIRGTIILLCVSCVLCLIAVFSQPLRPIYFQRNKTKEAAWSRWMKEKQKDYIVSTKDGGSKRLDLRLGHWRRCEAEDY